MKGTTVTLSLFFEVARVIRSHMGKVLPISLGQFELLRFIADSGEPSMHDVAVHFKIAAPSATSLVNDLARGGYIARNSNTRDRREVRISLTKKGVHILRKAASRRKKVLEELLSPLSARDRRDLNRILNTILKHI